jgi:AraC-like DNA-binding protein
LARLPSYLKRHFKEDLALDELAAKHGLSKRSLFRHWTAQFGSTPFNFVHELRMTEAARLLQETDGDVLEIGGAVNYKGSACFCSAFKARFGLSPLKCRRSQK